MEILKKRIIKGWNIEALFELAYIYINTVSPNNKTYIQSTNNKTEYNIYSTNTFTMINKTTPWMKFITSSTILGDYYKSKHIYIYTLMISAMIRDI